MMAIKFPSFDHEQYLAPLICNSLITDFVSESYKMTADDVAK
jgi:hypothetical protein